MVHTRMDPEAIATNYWKLIARASPQLIEAYDNYYTFLTHPATIARRAHIIYQRTQRNLPLYDKWTLEELQAAWTSRNPTKSPAQITSLDRDALIQILEQADNTWRFPKFLELPPELREIIYERRFTIAHDAKVTLAAQPPITKVSKLVRNESLPSFRKYWIQTLSIKQDYRTPPFYDDISCRLLSSAAPAQLSKMRFAGDVKGRSLWPILTCAFTLGNGVNGLEIRFETWRHRSKGAAYENVSRAMEARIKAFAAGIDRRGGGLALRGGDAPKILALFKRVERRV